MDGEDILLPFGVIGEAFDTGSQERVEDILAYLDEHGFEGRKAPLFEEDRTVKDDLDALHGAVCILTQGIFDSQGFLKSIKRLLYKKKPVLFLLGMEIPFLSMDSDPPLKAAVESAYRNPHSKVSFTGDKLSEAARS
eukprot:CAMPEP_0113873422 /NCGR_PEP_ID=MMETSP0780_2-20120614/3759_1 /TAXON_ID=652834 /ORGANISM="Palpitomonas bilix" /LENGTH=136 /DNA_ID=CAMNT_0000859061 /DNA_START=246 /DNA_END=653 /DNA_ORIENTATION=- /assembly_acc=CAM_ASM_000599